MDRPSILADHPYAAFLDRVEKPARYAGGEVGSRPKPWDRAKATVCLAFPDVYDIGMSHLGFKILYKILNDHPDTLAERCYAPWIDMEAELTKRGLPLVSIESARPLKDFTAVGFSLQFELTYSNILTMLHLGKIPVLSADRGEEDPLILAGGPTATHPEPLAPFIDAFVIGDGEAKCTELPLLWASLREQGISRRDRLAALARTGAVYVPSLYSVTEDPATRLFVVDRPLVPDIPARVERSMVNINDYPFPDDGPTGGPEAIFDRMSIEIARGCTEGCRFCQAGMIYRPVRERDPQQIVDTVLSAVKKSGQDEVSLTALSTADVSCISPLLKTVAQKLAEQRISLGVSSLRAYGLEPDLLDEIKRVRATGLTFAPEAGSARMRDVVNKNVTEEQLLETADRVFSRGWGKMKLYFMMGLPTETDEDLAGIVETGARAADVGRRVAPGRRAEVTVSVSVHVPKPHTPFQWAAMDPISEVDRKQALLRTAVRGHRAVTLKTHDAAASVLEGVFARGDRRLGPVLLRAWQNGARFDSWDDQLKLDVWEEAFSHFRVDQGLFLGTLPVRGRLPWDHIDVGLEDGFLAKEYRKALQNRLSPPCGKVAGAFVHETNVEDAEAEKRKLVCYDCGVACDMTQMREERITFLRALGAEKRRLPVVEPSAPSSPAIEEAAPEPPADPAPPADVRAGAEGGAPPEARKKIPPIQGRGGHLYRFKLEKTGPAALLSHLDVAREIPRVLRRVGVEMVYTRGFHPKPDMSFGPALSLGVLSLGELMDLRLSAAFDDAELRGLVARMTAAAPKGLTFVSAARVGPKDPSVSRVITGARYAIAFAKQALIDIASPLDPSLFLAERCKAILAAETLPVRREVDGLGRNIDVRKYLVSAGLARPDTLAAVARAGLFGDLLIAEVEVLITGNGAAKSSEVAEVLCGDAPHRAVRVALVERDPTQVAPRPTDEAV